MKTYKDYDQKKYELMIHLNKTSEYWIDSVKRFGIQTSYTDDLLESVCKTAELIKEEHTQQYKGIKHVN